MNTLGFAEKLEHWHARVTVSDTKADVYDGQVWKDFQTDKFNYFLKKQRSVGVMLNVDFSNHTNMFIVPTALFI